MVLSPVLSTTVLGKRKAAPDSFVLHLASSPEPSTTSYALSDDYSDFEIPPADNKSSLTTKRPNLSTSRRPPILVNGTLVSNTKRRYKCTYAGCDKSYTKPSRLEEHERSHTGDRPFVCETCKKSYLRETHLQAHARSHLPDSSRPFECPQPECNKRFWTSQHLRVHEDMHRGAKPFQCTESPCSEAFSKHHQLRSHIASAHAPPGTKPYRCTHAGCTKSFSTNQKLRAHAKVHDKKRYTCVHPSCVRNSSDNTSPTCYYQTWTALQHHTRTAHPPSCSHPSCNNRTFASQKGLRAHQKLHEQRDMEAEFDAAVGGDDEDGEDGDEDENSMERKRKKKKRRGGEMGRDWKCEVEGCTKDFKSKKALTTHTNVTHLGRRDHVCPHPKCAHAFGYKHLLQRHLAKVHSSIHPSSSSSDAQPTSDPSDNDGDDDGDETEHEPPRKPKRILAMDIDTITGKTYATNAQKRLHNSSSSALQCPYPHVQPFVPTMTMASSSSSPSSSSLLPSTSNGCGYVYTRAYDLRRHLRAEHEVDAEKEVVDKWVKDTKRTRQREVALDLDS